MTRAWVIRATDDIRPYIQSKKAIAVGWSITSEVSHISTPSQMLDFFRKQPQLKHEKEARQRNTAPQLFHFVNTIDVGDYALTPLPETATVLVGIVLGDYVFDPEMFPFHHHPDGHPHTQSCFMDALDTA